jgi:nucleotide-binding universal stress UspA family protein
MGSINWLYVKVLSWSHTGAAKGSIYVYQPIDKEAYPMIPTNILFCTDFSENSSDAFNCAVDYARAFDANLCILHVLDVSGIDLLNFADAPDVAFPSYGSSMPPEIKEEIQKSVRDNTRKALDQIRLEVTDKIKNVSTHFAEGVTSVEIVRFAEENSIDLIVMGTHGRTGFKHLIIGSTAENVVRMAKCPVLTVKSANNTNSFL